MHVYLGLAFVALHTTCALPAGTEKFQHGKRDPLPDLNPDPPFDTSLVVAIVSFIVLCALVFFACFFGPKLLRRRRRASNKILSPLPPPAKARPKSNSRISRPTFVQPVLPKRVFDEREADREKESGPGFGFDGLSASVLDGLWVKELRNEKIVDKEELVTEDEEKAKEGNEDEYSDEDEDEDEKSPGLSEDDASFDLVRISEIPPVISLRGLQSARSFHFKVELWQPEGEK